MAGLTLDTGALIAIADSLTRKRGAGPGRHVVAAWTAAVDDEVPVTVPALVLCEFWRGQAAGPVVSLVDGVEIDDVDKEAALAIGLYLTGRGRTGPSMVDASVVISAARRGDVIYTSDIDDLARVVTDLGLERHVRLLDLDQ